MTATSKAPPYNIRYIIYIYTVRPVARPAAATASCPCIACSRYSQHCPSSCYSRYSLLLSLYRLQPLQPALVLVPFADAHDVGRQVAHL